MSKGSHLCQSLYQVHPLRSVKERSLELDHGPCCFQGEAASLTRVSLACAGATSNAQEQC